MRFQNRGSGLVLIALIAVLFGYAPTLAAPEDSGQHAAHDVKSAAKEIERQSAALERLLQRLQTLEREVALADQAVRLEERVVSRGNHHREAWYNERLRRAEASEAEAKMTLKARRDEHAALVKRHAAASAASQVQLFERHDYTGGSFSIVNRGREAVVVRYMPPLVVPVYGNRVREERTVRISPGGRVAHEYPALVGGDLLLRGYVVRTWRESQPEPHPREREASESRVREAVHAAEAAERERAKALRGIQNVKAQFATRVRLLEAKRNELRVLQEALESQRGRINEVRDSIDRLSEALVTSLERATS